MPVNMDPSKKRRRSQARNIPKSGPTTNGAASAHPLQTYEIETEADREKDLADAELRNLWEATEVIDMDKV